MILFFFKHNSLGLGFTDRAAVKAVFGLRGGLHVVVTG